MRIIKRTLDNGLTVILAPMPAMKTVTGIFAVRAGWKYETSENHGVAHFLEHMAFKGTRNRPTALDINKEVDSKGGFMNAFTSPEMTQYWLRLSYQYADFIYDILSDILLNSLFKPEEIEKEKGTIIEELRMYHDTPSAFISMIAWPKLLYGNQPAGRLCVGTEESIKTMQKRHFVEFLENLYTNENAIFVLAGRIAKPEEVFGRINELFSSIKKGMPGIIKPTVITFQDKPALFLESRDIQQTCLSLGVRAYNVFYPENKKAALSILEIILGGFSSSRLHEEIREKRGWAYYIGVNWEAQTDAGALYTFAGINRDKTLEAAEIIINEYRKLCEEKVPKEELQRAKDFFIGSWQMFLESPANIASFLARQWAIKGEFEPFPEEIKRIKAVTSEDVQEVAREIFVNKGLNLAIIGPHEGMEEEFLKILRF